MKLSYQLVSGGSYIVLGDESARSALLENFQLSFQPQNQQEPLFRAVNTFKAARGNIAVSLQCVVSVPYASLAAALAGCKTLKDALAAQVHLKVEQDATIHYYPNALLTSFAPQFNGLTVRYQITLSTDDIVTTAP